LGLRGGRVSERDLTRWRGATHELADNLAYRVDAILALRPDGYLVQSVMLGRDRTSGGRFEETKLDLRRFDPRGRMVLSEWCDVEGEAEALARFETLDEPRHGEASRRRVRRNAACAVAERVAAIVKARDTNAVAEVFGGITELVEHATGGSLDPRSLLVTW